LLPLGLTLFFPVLLDGDTDLTLGLADAFFPLPADFGGEMAEWQKN
jgi:hypothetical protein